MKISDLKDYHRGWFIGNFEPSVLKTSDFEIGILTHKKDEFWPKHVHKISTEINLLISGLISINGTIISPGQIFVIDKNEPSKAVFLEDCKVLVIKIPSVPGDKYELEF